MDELDILRSLDPADFEQFVAEKVLPVLGLTPLSVTGGPDDAGCDIIAFDSRLGNKWCVQVKRYSEDKKVTTRDVREVVLGMEHHKCDRGLIVTTSELNGPALKEAKDRGIDCINSSRLLYIIRQYGVPMPLTSKLVPGNSNEVRKKGEMAPKRERKGEEAEREEGHSALVKVKDDGAFLPISVSEAVRVAKDQLSRYKEVKLVSVKAHLKRLYFFKVKVSYKLKGRRSQSLILGIDADGNVYEDIPTLVKDVGFEVEYETNSELYHSVRDRLTKEAEEQAPEGASDIEVKMENYKLAWVVSYYVLRFTVGLTEAEVVVDRQGKVKGASLAPLDEEKLKRFYGGRVVRQDKGIKVVRDLDDKFLEELEVNEAGEVVETMKRVRPEYAVGLTKAFYHVQGGASRFKEESDGVKVDVFFNNYHYLAKVDNGGRIVDGLIVPDANVYAGTKKGYNKKRRCLIVNAGDVINVIDARGVVERREVPKGVFSKLKFSVSNFIASDYSIDTDDPLDLI
ncbi:restriction endonuclease [Stygiolobus caldivivus]|uniref:restriction endonuclease n=1 Tax=Stygiolobus caldivivus TaxID=2824673 RepID=UPI001C854D31|nr:restriction endonuclease [Stygiolobus caldivivus]